MNNSELGRSLSSLAVIVLVSAAIAVPTAMALAGPVIYVSESLLHLGCSSSTTDGQQVWVCPDRIGYVFPGMAVAALVTLVGVVVGICVQREALGSPAARRALAMITSLLAVVLALPVGGAIIVCGVLDVSGAYGRWLIPIGLAVAGAALAVLVALQQARLRATVTMVAALVVIAALTPVAALAIPFVVVLAGVFVVSGALYSTTQTPRQAAALD